MLSITKISPGVGSIRYLMDQVARGRLDFRPITPDGVVGYYADPTAHGEAPGWWAGAGTLGVRGVVTEQQMRLLVGEGRHPLTGVRLGHPWRSYARLTDEARAQ